jgi:hypothetical protein
MPIYNSSDLSWISGQPISADNMAQIRDGALSKSTFR